GGALLLSGVYFLLVSELLEWAVGATTEEVVCFGCGQPGWTAEREVFERRLGVFFAVEDGDAVIHLGPPEPVVSGSVADDMLAGDVLVVVVQGGVEWGLGGDVRDVPRRHRRAGAEIFLGGDLTVGSEVFTNGDLMRMAGVVVDVGSIGSHTTDPTS